MVREFKVMTKFHQFIKKTRPGNIIRIGLGAGHANTIFEFISKPQYRKIDNNHTLKLLPILLLFFSFASAQNRNAGDIPTVEFCDLSSHAGEVVRVTCSYSGVEEYWSLGKADKEKCDNEYKVNLGIPNRNIIPEKFQKKFAEVGKSYWDRYLVMTIVGVFETGQKSGYGYKGSNNAQFNVHKIESVDLKKKD